MISARFIFSFQILAAARAVDQSHAGVKGVAGSMSKKAEGFEQSPSRGRWVHLDRASFKTNQSEANGSSRSHGRSRSSASFHG